MKGQSNIYHLCNLSPKVIFRNREDYLNAINRLAACAYDTSTEVWAYAFMSTHFHLIVRSDNIDDFIKLFKINLSRSHNKKYLAHIQVLISKRCLNGKGDILTATNYVLKNPIHHQVTEVAFSYPYSSAHLYYKDKIKITDDIFGMTFTGITQKSSDLNTRDYRKLFGSHIIPEEYIVINNSFINPECFVKIKIIEKLYESVRGFLYNMNKPLKEELEMFDSDTGTINSSSSGLSLFGKLNDMQVCEIIDRYLVPRTHTRITPEEKSALSNILNKAGVNNYQLERCL